MQDEITKRTACALILCLSAAAPALTTTRRPNILMIIPGHSFPSDELFGKDS